MEFDALAHFLTAETNSGAPCPLPIHATPLSRPRYTPYHAMKECHIFRDRYERRLPPTFQWTPTFSSFDFPEIDDAGWQAHHISRVQTGADELDEAKLREVTERLRVRSYPVVGGGYGMDVIEPFIAEHKRLQRAGLGWPKVVVPVTLPRDREEEDESSTRST